MDERELVGLVYRVDWTRLSLSGTVRGAGRIPNTTFTHQSWPWVGTPGPGSFPMPDTPPPPPFWAFDADGPRGMERSFVLAPGRRYRLTNSDGSRVIGCDGERAWQWFADLPPDTEVRFNQQPELPIPELLAPVWLLLDYQVTIEGQTTAAGRPGIAVTAVERTRSHRHHPGSTPSWGRIPDAEQVAVVIDAELGILLRCETRLANGEADVTEFVTLDVGGQADAAVFRAPEGSLFGGGPSGEQGADRGRTNEFGREAVKMVAGLAAGGLGAAIKYRPKTRPDAFGTATAEDPDDMLPADEPLPGWAADGADEADGRIPVGDGLLHLLYRGGLEASPFSGSLHEWLDLDVIARALAGAVPESARQTGFGGVGLLVDSLLLDERGGGRTGHSVHSVRVGGWDRYRVDLVTPMFPGRTPKLRVRHSAGRAATIACDGVRTFHVYDDHVQVGPASTLDESKDELSQLVDGSWLLHCRLSGGDAVEVDGRAGYRVIATHGSGQVIGAPLSWLPTWWLPAVAVVDASTGRLLRLTRYRGADAAVRLELRSVAEGGSDDFGFSPPEGLRVEEKPDRTAYTFDSDGPDGPDGPKIYGPDGQVYDPGAHGGIPLLPVQAVVDAVKDQVEEKVAAALVFLESFLGGRR